MLETWRWFGPDDPVTLENARQAGAAGIVTALHHLNQGGVWTEAEVAKRRAEVEAAGLTWAVVESIGVGGGNQDPLRRLPAQDRQLQAVDPQRGARRGENHLLQLHGHHRLDPHRAGVEVAQRRVRAAV